MNLIMEKGKVLNTADIFVKMCEIQPSLYKSIRPDELVEFVNSRIVGDMCDCGGEGVFELLPLEDEAVQEGGKRYMVCTVCGVSSHL